MQKNEKILVGGGVAGNAIIRLLREMGFTNILMPSHSELDYMSEDKVDSFFALNKPDYVFLNAVRMGGISYRNGHPAEILSENIRIEVNIITAAHRFGVKKLLFMASDFIYPEKESGLLREDDFLTALPEKKDFPYVLAKIAGVKLCDYYREEYGDRFYTVVPCAFFGVGSSFEIERANVVMSLIRRMHDAKISRSSEFILWGTGRPVKEFLLSDDVASACFLLMEKELDRGLYNVGSGTGGTSIWDLAQIIKNVVGYEGKIICDLSKPDGILRRVPDSSRIRALGWRPRYGLRQAIEIAYEYFLSVYK